MGNHFPMNVSDLTPDALAELEAKLVADLEMVPASFVSYWRSTARDLRHIIRKATGRDPEGEWVRGLLSRMVPQTKAVVHQFRKGRHGCL